MPKPSVRARIDKSKFPGLKHGAKLQEPVATFLAIPVIRKNRNFSIRSPPPQAPPRSLGRAHPSQTYEGGAPLEAHALKGLVPEAHLNTSLIRTSGANEVGN